MADVPRARKGQGLADLHSDCFSDLAICLSEVNRAAQLAFAPFFILPRVGLITPRKEPL